MIGSGLISSATPGLYIVFVSQPTRCREEYAWADAHGIGPTKEDCVSVTNINHAGTLRYTTAIYWIAELSKSVFKAETSCCALTAQPMIEGGYDYTWSSSYPSNPYISRRIQYCGCRYDHREHAIESLQGRGISVVTQENVIW